MSLLDKISSTELKAIEAYINAYGARNEGTHMSTTVPHVLRFWDTAKSEYLERFFGDELIISKTLNFEKSFEEVEDSISKKLFNSYYSHEAKECEIFIEAWHELQRDLGIINENALNERRYSSVYWGLDNLLRTTSLASNRYEGNSVEIPLPQGKKYRLLPGAKVSKAIGKIASAYKLKGYERFRILHSQVLNEKSLTGKVCLSIHPLDYMTMSDNDCGWSSCMSWNNFGDFRQGTVEMMNSPCVVVAYLKSTTDFILPGGYEWNSKRWRELFIVTPNVIAGIKGYPYWNDTLENAVLNWIRELVDPEKTHFEDKVRTWKSDKIDDIIPFRFLTRYMYNDMYSNHKMYIAEDYSLLPSEIEYSGISECLCCGDAIEYNITSEADLFCTLCDESYRCVECGDYHSLDELIELDGEFYCEYCYSNVAITCPDCGDDHHFNDFIKVYVAKDDNTIYSHIYFEICSECLDYKSRFFDNSKVKSFSSSPWSREYYIPLEFVTDEGKDFLDWDDDYDGPTQGIKKIDF